MAFDNGAAVEIVGVIDDLSASGAELLVGADTGRRSASTPSGFSLVDHSGTAQEVQESIREALGRLGDDSPIRFRAPTDTTWLRHGDSVLPLAEVKRRFGEFAIRNRAGRSLVIDPRWVGAHIVVAEVPILGTIRCHRLIVPAVAAVMSDLVDRGLEFLVDPSQFSGCYAPRRIAAGAPVSHHSWGIAVDLNIGDNPRGSFDTQDPRLVEAMQEAGFGWGGTWLVPDPGHYEATGLG
ncbi:MAG: M15 family metallopeptidase [Acidimicrobiales bacterium]